MIATLAMSQNHYKKYPATFAVSTLIILLFRNGWNSQIKKKKTKSL
jgi:hypothetical protein